MKRYYIIYCRKSTESEEKQLQSIDDQRNILQDLADEKGLHVLQTFEEEKSAKAPGRPVFNQMMELIKSSNDIKGILAWKLNRLSRNPVDSGALQWLIQTNAINEIITPAKTYLDADSDFLMSIEGAQANKFIRDLREDTIRGINSKIEKGWKPGLAPVGYRNQVEKPKGLRGIEPHPVYFPLVKQLFQLALTKQYSIDALGYEAQRLGLVTAKGKVRHKNNIWKLLTNPFYCGRFLYKGVLYKGSHERMISDKEFDLVQKYISSRAKPRSNAYPIYGFIRCVCGYMISGSTRNKTYQSGKKARFVYYLCSQRPVKKCNQLPIPAKELEQQVSDFLGTIKLSPRLIKWAIQQLTLDHRNQVKTKEAQIIALTKNLMSVKKKLTNLFELLISDDNEDKSMITSEEYSEMRQSLLIQKADIEEELKKTDGLQSDWMDVAIRVFNFASKAQDVWETGTIEQKRTILHAVGASITLEDKKLNITPRSMFEVVQQTLKAQNARENALGSYNQRSVRREGFEPS